MPRNARTEKSVTAGNAHCDEAYYHLGVERPKSVSRSGRTVNAPSEFARINLGGTAK